MGWEIGMIEKEIDHIPLGQRVLVLENWLPTRCDVWRAISWKQGAEG